MPIAGKLGRCWKGCLRLAVLVLPLVLAGCFFYQPRLYERLTLAPDRPTLRVLMIGDSLTYYNDLPGLLQQLSAGEAAPIVVEQITTPLASLKFHWMMGRAVDRIRAGHWDCVVLQDYSREPVTDPEESIRYFSLFDDEIKRSGAKTIIFENWTRRDMEGDYAALENTYDKIQAMTHARMAPIGAAWRRCSVQRPDIELLIDDRHPTDAGTYLAACVLYDVLYNTQAAVLPRGLPAPKLPENVLVTLRSIADGAVAAASGSP